MSVNLPSAAGRYTEGNLLLPVETLAPPPVNLARGREAPLGEVVLDLVSATGNSSFSPPLLLSSSPPHLIRDDQQVLTLHLPS